MQIIVDVTQILPFLRLISYVWATHELWSLSVIYWVSYKYTSKKESQTMALLLLAVICLIGVLFFLNITTGWVSHTLSQNLTSLLIIPTVAIALISRRLEQNIKQ